MITGILGPNGAGKSTTMRMIAGALQPDSGRASIDGVDVQRERVRAQQLLGVLPDKRGLYQRLSSRENIGYYGRLHGLKGPDLEKRIDQLIALLDMHDIATRRTEGFSTGQKLKVSIARSLVHSPPNIMLDEPTLGLDVMSTRAMRQVIRRLSEDGHTVLLSSHIMQEVASLCDNIVIINHGRVVAEGTPYRLRQQTGQSDLEEAFVAIIGSGEGLQ